MTMPENRTETGQFKKGTTGNPGGRPRNALGDFLRLKTNLPQEIYDAIYPLLKSEKEQTRIWAAEFLRDSAWGKPAQVTTMVDEDGNVLNVSLVAFAAKPETVWRKNGTNGSLPISA